MNLKLKIKLKQTLKLHSPNLDTYIGNIYSNSCLRHSSHFYINGLITPNQIIRGSVEFCTAVPVHVRIKDAGETGGPGHAPLLITRSRFYHSSFIVHPTANVPLIPLA